MASYDREKKYASENLHYFNQFGIPLQDNKLLDIGFGYGFNSNIFREAGANVYGVEPKKEAFDFAISNHLIDPSKAFNTTLQEMPKELLGTFDLATILLYNIPFSERETVMKLLAKSIKPTGTVIISLLDDIYKYGDQYVEKISTVVSRYFKNVRQYTGKYNTYWESMFIIAQEPRLLDRDIPTKIAFLNEREAELSSLEAEGKTISEAEALSGKQTEKEGEDIGEQ